MKSGKDGAPDTVGDDEIVGRLLGWDAIDGEYEMEGENENEGVVTLFESWKSEEMNTS